MYGGVDRQPQRQPRHRPVGAGGGADQPDQPGEQTRGGQPELRTPTGSGGERETRGAQQHGRRDGDRTGAHPPDECRGGQREQEPDEGEGAHQLGRVDAA
ncbi:hypothetical protein GCM10027614_65170 [Micromonospora vulcania]